MYYNVICVDKNKVITYYDGHDYYVWELISETTGTRCRLSYTDATKLVRIMQQKAVANDYSKNSPELNCSIVPAESVRLDMNEPGFINGAFLRAADLPGYNAPGHRGGIDWAIIRDANVIYDDPWFHYDGDRRYGYRRTAQTAQTAQTATTATATNMFTNGLIPTDTYMHPLMNYAYESRAPEPETPLPLKYRAQHYLDTSNNHIRKVKR